MGSACEQPCGAILASRGCLFRTFVLCARLSSRTVKLTVTRGHISLAVAFKGPNIILGLCKCNYSLTRGQELSTAAGWKQGAGQIKQGGGPDAARGPCVCPWCPEALIFKGAGGGPGSPGAVSLVIHLVT